MNIIISVLILSGLATFVVYSAMLESGRQSRLEEKEYLRKHKNEEA